MTDRHAGRTFIVTGAGMGIGAATAWRLASEGAEVILVDRDQAAGARVADAILVAGRQARLALLDLANAQQVESFGKDIVESGQAINGLVNNAGIYRPATIEATDDAVFDVQIAVNLKAPLMLYRSLLPSLRRGKASVVNISSEAGYNARPGAAVYDATKAAVSALTRTMACEGAVHGMRANTVAPGPVVTELHTLVAADPEARRRELRDADFPHSILRRWGEPEEIAAVIAFVLSDDASFMTGTVLHVDGGHVAK